MIFLAGLTYFFLTVLGFLTINFFFDYFFYFFFSIGFQFLKTLDFFFG